MGSDARQPRGSGNWPGRTLAAGLLAVTCGVVLQGCEALTRDALFFPTHHDQNRGLTRWTAGGSLLGFAREVPAPEHVWLMLHGNGGQAADRAYALPAFSPRDSVFILEYPGYGLRSGKPSRSSFDAAARQAYDALRTAYPDIPVCVVAESIGSGPAATLGALPQPPDKLVFIVPFDDLKSVASDHVRFLPVGALLAGSWNNVAALSGYDGPMDVFGARDDEIIAVRHARALASSRPQARFHLLSGGHNDWAMQPEMQIRYSQPSAPE